MSLDYFFERHYSPPQQLELRYILKKNFFYNELEKAIDDFYLATSGKNNIEIISSFVLTCTEYVTIIYRGLQNMEQGKQKSAIRRTIADLSIRLIRDTWFHSGISPAEYAQYLFQTVRKTFIKNAWNFSVLERKLNPRSIRNFGIKDHSPGNKRRLSGPVKLFWQGEKQLDFFIDDLARHFNGSKKQFYQLFEIIKTDFKIRLPSKHLLPFLSLFYQLHQSRIIKVQGNRGLFIYLTQHLQAPDKDIYPKRDFRKLRHDAEQNEKLKKKNLHIIKPLLDKYCGNA